MSSEQKPNSVKTYKDYMDIIDVVCKVEYKRLNSGYIIDYEEIQNIAIFTVYSLLQENQDTEFNVSYLSTAIKWAIRNELRRRYNWYGIKTGGNENELGKEQLREAIYETILSIDEMAEADNPTQISYDSRSLEENAELIEINSAIKNAIKKLPPRYREIIEARFFHEKKLKDLSDEYELSPSRITRIIQNALEKIKKDLQKQTFI
jgi:RNA polymerase sigma factor (sigma-70 family)